MGYIRFIKLTQNEYDNVSSKLDDNLYFCEDTKRIYKGNKEYTRVIRIVNELPDIDNAEFGYLYYIPDLNELHYFIGDQFIMILKITNVINENSTDNEVPTALAVYNFVNNL